MLNGETTSPYLWLVPRIPTARFASPRKEAEAPWSRELNPIWRNTSDPADADTWKHLSVKIPSSLNCPEQWPQLYQTQHLFKKKQFYWGEVTYSRLLRFKVYNLKVFTYASTHETITTIKLTNISIPPKSFSCPFVISPSCHFLSLPPFPGNHQSFCRYRLICIFKNFKGMYAFAWFLSWSIPVIILRSDQAVSNNIFFLQQIFWNTPFTVQNKIHS